MYYCKLDIQIYSTNPMLKELMKTIPVPDQFEAEFTDISALNFNRPDTGRMLIIDQPLTDLFSQLKAVRAAAETLIFCVDADLPEAAWEQISEIADAIWIRPLTPGKVRFYFQQTLNSMKQKKDLWLSQNYLESLINSIPDLVWFKDIRGAHLNVNDAFCHAVGKTKQDVIGRGHYYIWDLKREEYEKGEYVCLETEEMVLKARKTCLFDEKVKSKHGLRQFKTYKTPIFGEDGEPIGTVGIAHDVTDLENMGTELEIILRSMPFPILVKNSDGHILNINERFENYFHVRQQDLVGQNYDSWVRGALDVVKQTELDGLREVVIMKDHQERLLEIQEEPIHDIFLNRVGQLYIFRDITAQRQLEEQILYNSNTDFLTGLYNRRYFYEYVSRNRAGRPVSLIYVDLDHFKVVNDTYGHQAGDEALIQTAALLRECFPDAFLTRLGGDEFLILYLGAWAVSDLREKADSFRKRVVQWAQTSEKFKILTASIGISQTGDPAMTIDSLMRQSDRALYKAKHQGRNQIRSFG